MATALNVTIVKRTREDSGNIHVLWRPALEEVADFAGYGWQFVAPWTEQQIVEHGFDNAPQAIFAAIDSIFPGEYEQGTVV